MSVTPISGCLTSKQISQLNERLNELGFEFGSVLDESFAKILTANFNLCDAEDIPQDTAGEQQFLCIVDGNCTFVDKSETVDVNETVTTISYDPATGTITYTDEDGNATNLVITMPETLTTLTFDPTTNALTYTDEDGNPQVLTLPVNAISINPTTCEITYTDQLGADTVLSIPQPSAPSFDPATCELVFTDAKAVETRVVVTNINTGFDATTTPQTNFENYLGHDSDGKVVAVPLPDQIDVKCVTLCDLDSNTPYILEVTNNLTQGTKTTATFEVDGVTPYTPVTPGVYKPEQCFVDTVWVMDPAQPNGVREEYWDSTGTAVDEPSGTAQASAIPSVFNLTDACGLPIHPTKTGEGASADQENILTIFESTDPVDPAITHQNCLTAFIFVPEDNVNIFAQTTGVSSTQLYIGVCNDKKGFVYERVNAPGQDSIGIYSKGIYAVKAYVHDPGQAGRIKLRWQIPGQGQQDIPTQFLYLDMPEIVCKKVIIKKGDPSFYELDAATPIDANLEVFNCNPCEVLTPFTPIETPTKVVASVSGNERISVDSSAATTSALTVPNGSTGAIIQVIIEDQAEQAKCVNYYANGATSTATDGYQAGHKDYIYLGCMASNGANVTDPSLEVGSFNWHVGGVTAGNVTLEVTYYKC